MFSYRLFGLNVHSDIELSGIAPNLALGSSLDAKVELRSVAEEWVHDGNKQVIAEAEGTMRAYVIDGRKIIVEPEESADLSFVSAIVFGELFSVLLRQRGLVVLHGSVVTKRGSCVGFVGDSGWGKSTLAGALLERGWKLLADDLIVIDGIHSANPFVLPGHAGMRLTPEVAKRLGHDHLQLPRAHSGTRKIAVDHQFEFENTRAALNKIYVLSTEHEECHRITEASNLQAVGELMRHTRGQRLMNGSEARSKQLADCGTLVKKIHVMHLFRKHGLEYLTELCENIEADSLPSQSTIS